MISWEAVTTTTTPLLDSKACLSGAAAGPAERAASTMEIDVVLSAGHTGRHERTVPKRARKDWAIMVEGWNVTVKRNT